MVLVNINISRGTDFQVKASELGEELEHVVQELDRRLYAVLARPIYIQGQIDFCFLGFSCNSCISHVSTSFSLLISSRMYDAPASFRRSLRPLSAFGGNTPIAITLALFAMVISSATSPK